MLKQIQIYHNRLIWWYISLVAIDVGSRVARYLVQDKGSEAPLEEDGAPGHKVGDCLGLLLSGLPGKSASQLTDLLHCYRMPSAQ